MVSSQPRKKRVRPQRRLRTLLVIVAAAVFLLGTSYLARARLLTGLANVLTLDTVGPPSDYPADYIVPLGGAAESRPFVAAALYKEGLAPTVLLFEYKGNDAIESGLTPSQTELYRRVLELGGVPSSAIQVAPGIVDSTWDEAQTVGRHLPRDRPSRVVIVTSPEHTRRSLWAFQEALDGIPVDIRMAPAPHERFDETNWWQDDEGVLVYLREYLKFPYYWARYSF